MTRFLSYMAVVLMVLGLGGAKLEAADMTEKETYKKLVVAGGCFWCIESDFEKLDGVIGAVSGYTGGKTENPTYHDVSAGITGHYEAIEITYDPKKVTYEALLDYFWRHIDPLDGGGQFCDRGDQYRAGIFYETAEQKALVEKSKAAVEKELGQKVKTSIEELKPFYKAEEYHQDYYKKNPVRYKYYRFSCGRDKRVKKIWSKT